MHLGFRLVNFVAILKFNNKLEQILSTFVKNKVFFQNFWGKYEEPRNIKIWS